MSRIYILLVFLLFQGYCTISQEFTKKDSLRGDLSSVRTCYDVTFYNLFVIIDEKEKFIERSYNEIHFIAISDFDKIQIDLSENMEILLIEYEDLELIYTREFDAVFIDFPEIIQKGEISKIKIWYNGYPKEAINPPWDGGFSWDKDKFDNPWIGVSCQGLGASVWWPCKDHQSDEPDSMQITVSARKPLKVVANGNLINEESVWNNYLNDTLIQSTWFVSYPINNYGVSIAIGDYVYFNDIYISNLDTLDLSYYVLSYNIDKAKEHFSQVIPMLECFEDLFGKYPFWKDGFALIETPYLGMEHQSGIAYGNNYLPGYRGSLSYSAGFDFDYIIVHETGHEWWGNSITTNDIADMWVHEGFCTYSEALYVECMYGYESMLKYVNNQKRFIRNKTPIIGHFHVNHQGSSDMYHKGSVMLHTLRTIVNDDVLWFDILKGINTEFKYSTINGEDIRNYIMFRTGYDLESFFIQYLQNTDLPEFQYKLVKEGRHVSLLYRWEAIDSFDMPLLVNNSIMDIWIHPSSEWQEINLGKIDTKEFTIKDELFLIDVKKIK